jgi:galactokinase
VTAFEQEVSRLRAGWQFFRSASPVYIGRSPGRLDLMGGNVDYTGGLVFEATIREATWGAVQLRADQRIVFWNPQMSERDWFSLEIHYSQLGGWLTRQLLLDLEGTPEAISH